MQDCSVNPVLCLEEKEEDRRRYLFQCYGTREMPSHLHLWCGGETVPECRPSAFPRRKKPWVQLWPRRSRAGRQSCFLHCWQIIAGPFSTVLRPPMSAGEEFASSTAPFLLACISFLLLNVFVNVLDLAIAAMFVPFVSLSFP